MTTNNAYVETLAASGNASALSYGHRLFNVNLYRDSVDSERRIRVPMSD